MQWAYNCDSPCRSDANKRKNGDLYQVSGSKDSPVECQDAVFDQHDDQCIKNLPNEQVLEKSGRK